MKNHNKMPLNKAMDLTSNKSKQSGAETPGDAVSARAIPVAANRIESCDLFVGTREVTIGHCGETYRLRLTAQNKLILTK